jgi:hypothetical protein
VETEREYEEPEEVPAAPAAEEPPPPEPIPAQPESVNWELAGRPSVSVDKSPINPGSEVVLRVKVDPAWAGKKIKVHVYEDDDFFWNPHNHATTLTGEVQADGTVVTNAWKVPPEPDDWGSECEYFVRDIEYPDEAKTKVEVKNSPQIRVPDKKLVIGITGITDQSGYSLGGMFSGPFGMVGMPLGGFIGAKGGTTSRSATFKLEIHYIIGDDPLVRISVVHPVTNYPKPEGWSFAFVNSSVGFAGYEEDTATLWVPESDWDENGGVVGQAATLELQVEASSDGGFVPFQIRVEAVEPVNGDIFSAATPIYFMLAEGPGLDLDARFEEPQIADEGTEYCYVGALDLRPEQAELVTLLEQDLAERLGCVRLELPGDTSVASMLATGMVDFALVHFPEYLNLRSAAEVEPLAVSEYSIGSYWTPALAVRVEEEVDELHDLEEFSVACFTDPWHDTCQAFRALLAINDLEGMVEPEVFDSPQRVLDMVYNSHVQVAVIPGFETDEDFRHWFVDQFPLIGEETSMLWFQEPRLPFAVFVAQADLSTAQRGELQHALLESGSEETGLWMEAGIGQPVEFDAHFAETEAWLAP